MEEENKWYRSTELWLNLSILIGALLFGHFYAESKAAPDHYWDTFGKGTFYVTFFGNFILRMVSDSNRRRLNGMASATKNLVEKINNLSTKIHQTVDNESVAASKFREVILEVFKIAKSESSSLTKVGEAGRESAKSVDDARRIFDKAVKEGNLSEIVVSAKDYSDAADSFAEQLKEVDDVDFVFDSLALSVNDILEVHRKFFPIGFEIAGKLRTVPVYVTKFGQTSLGPENAQYVPPKPTEVLTRIKTLLDDWNSQAKALKSKSEINKIHALAKFHAAFTAIHPFLDGNGRVARILLKRQIQDLFGITVNPKFERNKPRYYDALAASNRGDLKPLQELFESLVSRRQ